HVDESRLAFRSAETDVARKLLHLVEADGRGDLDRGHAAGGNRGDATDPWSGPPPWRRRAGAALRLLGAALVAAAVFRVARPRPLVPATGLLAAAGVMPGFDHVETLVIDDGSTDATGDVARRAGATYLLRLPVHLGLARAFEAGLDAALKLGADVIVNTDADNQYRGADVARLVQPILAGHADMVIGDRAPHRVAHFGPLKRILQRLGSWVVRQLSGTTVPDAASGFRAFSPRAALRLNVFTKFPYTLETVLQARKKGIPIAHVPIATNPERRPSRLFARLSTYIKHSAATLVRIYALYEPLKVFWRLGMVFI